MLPILTILHLLILVACSLFLCYYLNGSITDMTKLLHRKSGKSMNIIKYKITWKSFFGMLIGNIILGLGVAIFKFSGLGNDPFSAMMMALADLTPLDYAALAALLNTFIFLIEFTFGKYLIGIGTLVNWVLLGYFVTFFYNIMQFILAAPQNFMIRLVYLFAGVIILSFGISLYQSSDSGIAPFDSLSIIMDKHLPLPYFWCRLITDVICAFICFMAGGLLGIGTLTCALCLGPFVHFFNQRITYKLMHYKSIADYL